MKLVLEDGSEFAGRSFGFPKSSEGEAVFNTGMTGYVETLTDPSYKGQILVCTYPLLGNYGVPEPAPAGEVPPPFESERIHVSGLVVVRYSERHSHHAASRSLGEWLKAEGIPAVEGIDTRALTRRLREKGVMRGRLVLEERDLPAGARADAETLSVDINRVVDLVSCKTPRRYGPDNGMRVALVDCGMKQNILRCLVKRGLSVLQVPWNYDLPSLYDQVDGFFVSNGPGDPKDCRPLIDNLGKLLQGDKPVFGICLGHQLLALAAGADTYKLPYGHRSQNQPVQDLLTRRCYVTSQNHGYAVRQETLPAGWDPWFININDETNEGIRMQSGRFASVQFHPEAFPGPVDTGYLFDEFVRMTARGRSGHAM